MAGFFVGDSRRRMVTVQLVLPRHVVRERHGLPCPVSNRLKSCIPKTAPTFGAVRTDFNLRSFHRRSDGRLFRRRSDGRLFHRRFLDRRSDGRLFDRRLFRRRSDGRSDRFFRSHFCGGEFPTGTHVRPGGDGDAHAGPEVGDRYLLLFIRRWQIRRGSGHGI